MTEKLDRLQKLVEGKKVDLVCHWDTDGVTSGAILYHLIKDKASSISTLSKGDVFSVLKEDVNNDAEVIICADIAPSDELEEQKVIYIDHHPIENKENFLMSVHDENIQSCSLIIWQDIIPETNNPYFIFLTLLGYFGDGGSREEIPPELQIKANEVIPEMMNKYNSFFGSGYFYNIERYVSALNTGKRMLWKGDVPLSLLTDIENYEDFTKGRHHTAQLLETFKSELKCLYNMKIDIKKAKNFDYSIIECNANIQGVLCARYIKDKPIIVMNQINGNVIGSMRVPEEMEFDAGEFLNNFNKKFSTYIGGGHEKAGGFTISQNEFSDFLNDLVM